MNENELIQEIRWEVDPRNSQVIPKRTLSEESFVRKFKPSLFQAFKELGLKSQGWKWHRFVDYCTRAPEDYDYLYQRILELVLDLRNSYEDFFELRMEEGTCLIPNPLADLNRIESLFEDYFSLYYRIKNKLHFDLPGEEYKGPIIRGKVLWDRTIKNSKSVFPVKFHSMTRKKEFATPENILLVLCSEWIYKESSRLLSEEYVDPLNESQIRTLEDMMVKSKSILTKFPLPNVLLHSKRYWGLLPNDARIDRLVSETKNRILDSSIKNKNYEYMLEWIERFKEQNIWLVNSQTPTKRPLKTRKNLDAMYEAWIFFEFANHFRNSGNLTEIVIRKGERKFDFILAGKQMTLRWEKKFYPPGESKEEGADEKHAWAAEAWPDFTVFHDDKIIGVLDAKNYSIGEYETSAINKILAYMTNLETNLGVLFFPYKPEYWDEFKTSEKKRIVRMELKKHKTGMSDNEIDQMIGNIGRKKWNELNDEEMRMFDSYKPSVEFTRRKIKDPSKSQFEEPNLTMSLCRMTPTPDSIWFEMKKKSIEFVCHELIRRLKIEITQK